MTTEKELSAAERIAKVAAVEVGAFDPKRKRKGVPDTRSSRRVKKATP